MPLSSSLFDDHVHSCRSCDSQEPVSAICRAALQRGLAGVAITDHFDTEPADRGYGRYDYDVIRWDIEQARRDLGCRLEILFGVEVCFQPPYARRVADLLRACPLDYCMGSVHYVRHEYIGQGYWTRHPVYEAYDAYFEAVEATVASGLFDALGHLDVAKRYATGTCGPFDPQDHWERIERILRLLVERDMAMEINTSGWRQAPGVPYPDEAIVRRFVELGGKYVTIGSDAHCAADVGADVARAQDLLRRAGLTHVTRFVGHRPVLYPL